MRGHERRVRVFLVLSLLGGTGAWAQQDSLLPIRVGRILFSPSISYSYGVEDNVERTNEQDPLVPPLTSPIQDFRPILKFEAPFQRSSMILSYSARMRQYGSQELSGASGTNHYLDFAGRFQAAPSLRFEVEDHYLRGISGLQEVNPGGELRFSTRPFEENRGMAGLVLNLGAIQSLETGVTLVSSRFVNPDILGSTFDSNVRNLFARYLLALGPEIQLYGNAELQTVNQDRGSQPIEPSDYRTRSVGAGFRRIKVEGLTSDLRVSYALTDFPDGRGDPHRGISVDGDLSHRVGVSGVVGLQLRQGPLTSFFNTNAFYVNSMIGIGYKQDIGTRFRVTLTAGVQTNAYPEPVRVHVSGPEEEKFPHDENGVLDAYKYLLPSDGVKREDHLHTGAVKFLSHLGRPLDLEIGYRQDSARSNIVGEIEGVRYKIFDYDSSAWWASLTYGWQ